MSNSKRKAHCNKKPFPSLLVAQIHIKGTLKSSKKQGNLIVTGLNAYKCPYCKAYHIGRSAVKGINWNLIAEHDKKLAALKNKL